MAFIKKYYSYIIFGVFVFWLFSWMTDSISFYGDDWCYLTNSTEPALKAAIHYYSTWSGRLFSEMWTYIAVRHKEIYNIVNPVMFLVIFLSVLRLVNPKSKILTSTLLVALMLTVNDSLRMQTYTWCAGSVYIVSLCLIVVLLNVYYTIIRLNSKSRLLLALSCFLNFYISLTIENSSAMLAALNVILTIWLFYRKNQNYKWFFFYSMISITGFILMRLSPGSTYRLMRDHEAWLKLNIFEQIVINLPSFISITFFDYRALIFTFTAVLVIFVIQKEKKKSVKVYASLFYLLYYFLWLGNFLAIKTEIQLLDSLFDFNKSYFSLVIYLIYFVIYVLLTFFIMCHNMPQEKFEENIFYIVGAGIANGAMLLSPVLGHRTAVFTVYLLFIVLLNLVDSLVINKKIFIGLILVLCFIIYKKEQQFEYKYTLASAIDKERLVEIQYYKDNPEITEIWITAMPEYLVHSANIYPDDIVHSDAFKAYFGLNPEATIHMSYRY